MNVEEARTLTSCASTRTPGRETARTPPRTSSAISARSQRTSATFKGEANAYLTDPNYSTLRLRLEVAHAAVEAAAVEARRRVRLNEGR